MRHSLFLHLCMIDEARWCYRIYHLWSFSFHSRYPRSETEIGGTHFIIRWLPVPYGYYTMIQWPIISFWSLIISHLYWFRSGWDNGSIERASQQWCMVLCTCLKWITHSNRRIATYGVALYSWLEANVCEIHNWPELFVYVYRVLALWTGRWINIMAYRLPYTRYHGKIAIEIHMHRIHNNIYIYIYISYHIIYILIYLYLLLFLSICFVWCIC